jgi:hypothetical protein
VALLAEALGLSPEEQAALVTAAWAERRIVPLDAVIACALEANDTPAE